MNNFFSTFIQNLNILQYKEQDTISASISDPVMRAIVKYRAHPRIIAIKENCNSSKSFNFSFVDKEVTLKEINNWKANKATQILKFRLNSLKKIRTSLRVLFLKI